MKKRWITGQELMDKLSLTHQEVFTMIKVGLLVFDEFGRPILKGNPSPKRATAELGIVYDYMDSETFVPTISRRMFEIAGIRAFAKKKKLTWLIPIMDTLENEAIGDEGKSRNTHPRNSTETEGDEDKIPNGYPQTSRDLNIKTAKGTTWKNIRLVIRNNDCTEILEVTCLREHLGNFNPMELGFRGHGKKSGKMWTMLVAFAKCGGEIEAAKSSQEMKPTISRLRKLLHSIFPGIEGNPMPWNYEKRCWQTVFSVKFSEFAEAD